VKVCILSPYILHTNNSVATVNNYKKSALAKVSDKKEIPEPKGEYNIQIAMGLGDDKAAYNDCRVILSISILIDS
jgi:hypothetical protein